MYWEDFYKSKLVSTYESVCKIKSNDRVVIGLGVAEPITLVEAMIKNKDSYENVEIAHPNFREELIRSFEVRFKCSYEQLVV